MADTLTPAEIARLLEQNRAGGTNEGELQ